MNRLVAVLLVSALAAWSGEPAKRSRVAEAARLRVPVWTADGEPLEAARIEARVDGQTVNVAHLAGPGDDLLVLVVMDVAGDLTLVDPARRALVEALPGLPENTYLGLLRAQDGLRVLVDPGADRDKVASTLLGLTVSGRAGLLDTVETAARLGDSILAKARVRLAVLYITDSHVGNYRQDFTNPVVNSSDSRDLSRRFPEGLIKEKTSQVSQSLSRRQSPVFIVHLNYRSDRLNEAYQTGLMALATASGGAAEFCRSVAEIPAAIRKTLDAIAAHHSVELEVPESLSRQTLVEIISEGRSLRHRTKFQLRER